MPVYNRSKMEYIYYSNNPASLKMICTVRIDEMEIVVEYLKGINHIRYRGTNNGTGHFSLSMKCGDSAGQATLHQFPGGDILAGFWLDDDIRGMWRIYLSDPS